MRKSYSVVSIQFFLSNSFIYSKLIYNFESDLQMKPYRTDEFVHKLFYETSRFSAFNNQWVVKAHINNCQRDPTQSSERDITYQVILFNS